MTDVPQAAIDAAMDTIERLGSGGSRTTVRIVLEAAAPHIAATERASIIQLALRKRAVYCLACDGAPCGYDDILRPFADLLTEEDPS